MSNNLIFKNTKIKLEGERDFSESMLLQDISEKYKVFLLYYPAVARNFELEDKLKELGESSGKNLLVNIGSIGDDDYNVANALFDIEKTPVIVMSAVSEFAHSSEENTTAYIKFDDERLLNNTDLTIKAVDNMFNLFLSGKIREAILETKSHEKKAKINFITNRIIEGLKGVYDVIKGFEITISLLDGQFEISHSGSE